MENRNNPFVSEVIKFDLGSERNWFDPDDGFDVLKSEMERLLLEKECEDPISYQVNSKTDYDHSEDTIKTPPLNPIARPKNTFYPHQSLSPLPPTPLIFYYPGTQLRKLYTPSLNYKTLIHPHINRNAFASISQPKTKEPLRKSRKMFKTNVCYFCFSNEECSAIFRSHRLHNEQGKVECPILRRYVCPVCFATGDEAHTLKYCPLNRK